jgi:hypothetical protein
LRGLRRVSSSGVGHHAISNEPAPQRERLNKKGKTAFLRPRFSVRDRNGICKADVARPLGDKGLCKDKVGSGFLPADPSIATTSET